MLDDAGDYVWERKVCVRCSLEGNVTMLQTKRNNMPDHCPGNSLVNVQTFDYTVRFNALDSDTLAKAFHDLATLWTKVCPLTHCYDKDSLRIAKYECSELKGSLAFGLNGVAFQNANKNNNDPLDPQGL